MNKEELQKKIGKCIIQLRTEKGWSQADLARACNKDRQSIERMENGKVSQLLNTSRQLFEAKFSDRWIARVSVFLLNQLLRLNLLATSEAGGWVRTWKPFNAL